MDENLKAALADAVKAIPHDRMPVIVPKIPEGMSRMPTLEAPKMDERMLIIAPDRTGDNIVAKPRNDLPESVKKFAQGLAKSGAEITDLAPKEPSAPIGKNAKPSAAEAIDF
jgi:hypothetical protein